MRDELKFLLKGALADYLPKLKIRTDALRVELFVWQRISQGWNGRPESHPDLMKAYFASEADQVKAAQVFVSEFFSAYPAFKTVGIAGCGTVDYGRDPLFFFQSITRAVWDRFQSLDLNDAMIDQVVSEFETYVEIETMPISFRAILHGFRTECEVIHLGDGLKIRRLSDEEINHHYGQSPSFFGFYPPHRNIDSEYCIEGESSRSLIFANEASPGNQPEWPRISRAILGLRSFKSGVVWSEGISVFPQRFCPPPTSGFRIDGENYSHLRRGDYVINISEQVLLESHLRHMLVLDEPAIKMACSRLIDAELRKKTEDKIVDAVIGMESILLSALGRDERGELKFRFSMNYATLFDSPEKRRTEYRKAKSLYDLRSRVAHGGELGKGPHKVGAKTMNSPQAAQLAVDTLRYLIKHFLENSYETPISDHSFWEAGYFGMPRKRK